ncbi:DUF4858 domain-containing protein [Phocaeicola abscessus]|uniref:DUF4858 domain-containing protein n=1 Tax=Phocaeicola abscessus TaxID=555313 RepID=UPI0028E93001|nr:DUF4858 domain-containing protein [Phocaeicola abscessus]
MPFKYRFFLIMSFLSVAVADAQVKSATATKIRTKKTIVLNDDSLKLKRIFENKGEIKLNGEAINAIDFDYLDDEPSMLDAPKLTENQNHLQFREDIVKNPAFIEEQQRGRGITMKLNPNSHSDVYRQTEHDIKNRRISSPSYGDYTILTAVGFALTFDANKFLTENLTKHGRTLRHNRKYALAWKKYSNHIPAKRDSVQKDSTLLLRQMYEMANRLYPGVADSLRFQKK